jgi:hypothetical protein
MRPIKRSIRRPRVRNTNEIENQNINRNVGTIQTKLLIAIKNSELTEDDMASRFGKAWYQLMDGTIRMRKLARIVNSLGYRIVLEKNAQSPI